MPYRLITLLAVGVAVVAAAGPSSAARTTVCRHADVVFYSTDSVRLAQRLHANPSACADYYISVTPAADGISPRANVAPTIRANGSHAMPELRLPGWAAWVATNGKTWFDAGVEARVRMQTAGFDVSKGDTWALNEVGSPSNTKLGVDVFTNAGTARADMREFVRGLYTGAAGMAPSPGLVFVADPLQMSSDLAQYKTQLQDWYADSAFWSDMSRYVRFWGQETYADARAWGVADSGLATRGDHLDDYFQHANLLAQAGPGSVNAARSFLQAAYTPIGNAAFPQPAPEANPGGIGFGYTAISPTSMQNFVSTQIYALRAFHAAGASTAGDQFGFAWVPNTSVTPPPTFVSLADRLAAAIHDSEADPNGACGATAEWCDTVVDAARFNEAWKSFATWSPATNTFEGSSVRVQVAPVTVTFASVSSRGSTQATTSASGFPPPPGLRLQPGSLYYDVETTAAYTGQIDVCIGYDPAAFTGFSPHLFQAGAGDVTSVVDTSASSVCGSTASLGAFAVFAADPTPPTIAPHVDGPQGNSGWYTGDVTATWDFADPQSAIASTSGCQATTIANDTTGTTLTCTALSDGGSSSESVTVRRDATPPRAEISLTRPPDSNGWYNHSVGYSTIGADATSGIDTCTSGTYDGPDSAAATVTGSCTDRAGNVAVASPATIEFDGTPPTVTAARLPGSAPNGNGWNNDDVTVRFTVSDSLSGPATSTVDVVVSSEGESQSVEQTLADVAGNTASASLGGISIDKTAPSLHVPSSVTVDATSPSGATVTFPVNATDALDPAPTTACMPASGSLFPAGTTSVTCAATDRAGNRVTATLPIRVKGAVAQIQDLAAEIVDVTAIPHGLKVALLAQLNAVLARFDPTNAAQKRKACTLLAALARAVENAERQNVIAVSTGTALLSASRRITAALGC